MSDETTRSTFCWWLIKTTDGNSALLPASCPRLAAKAWGDESLHVVDTHATVTVVFNDLTSQFPQAPTRLHGPYRVERVSKGAVWVGKEGDLSAAPRLVVVRRRRAGGLDRA